MLPRAGWNASQFFIRLRKRFLWPFDRDERSFPNDEFSMEDDGEPIGSAQIQDYPEDQRNQHRRPKTVEWHHMVSNTYLLSECHLTLLRHLTEKEIQGWVAFLGEDPTTRGNHRTNQIARIFD